MVVTDRFHCSLMNVVSSETHVSDIQGIALWSGKMSNFDNNDMCNWHATLYLYKSGPKSQLSIKTYVTTTTVNVENMFNFEK